jgi:hypothetical protein
VVRAARILTAAALIGICGIAPRAHDIGPILGVRPSYGPVMLSNVPNLAATGPLLWMPGLDEGWDPQGLAAVDGYLLVSAYKSEHFGVNRGPCRVFRVDPASGHETGHFDVPLPCGHAGGLAYGGGGMLYIADTHSLFEVALDRAFAGPAPEFRIFPLGPGVKGALAASAEGAIWIGTYEEDRPGRIFRYDRALLQNLAAGTVLSAEMAAKRLDIPSYAQGAAVAPAGALWIARSEIGWGCLDKLDSASGRLEQRYAVAGGIEGIAFDATGLLWGVSEAGARHLPLAHPFFPLIFGLDTARLRAG